jgi:hypothetical protein
MTEIDHRGHWPQQRCKVGKFQEKKRLLGIETQKTPLFYHFNTLKILSTVTVVAWAAAMSAITTMSTIPPMSAMSTITAMSAIVTGRIYCSRIVVNMQRIMVHVQRIMVNMQRIMLVQRIAYK